MARKTKILLIILFFVIGLIACFFFLLFTPAGSRVLTRRILAQFVSENEVTFQEVEGHLGQGITYKNLELVDLKGFPEGSILRIQEAFLSLASLNAEGLIIDVQNARVLMPDSDDPIVLGGLLRKGILDFNIFARNISLEDLIGLLPQRLPQKVTGMIRDIDISMDGPYAHPRFLGQLEIEKAFSNGFSAQACPVAFDFELNDVFREMRPFGVVNIAGGTVSGPKTAVINLQDSKIAFEGDPQNPVLDIRGSAAVGGTKIQILLKGKIKEPDLRLSSQPTMPQEKLLLMLATNQSWKGLDKTIEDGRLSADLAKDFIDYFIFSGQGRKMAQRFGISDISFKYDEQTKGFGVKKEINKNIEASYDVTQTQKETGTQDTTHTLGGELRLNENISVAGEKGFKQQDRTSQETKEESPNGQIMLKYKKEF